MPTRILLIRHAATDPMGRICGWFDIGLSPRGRMDLAAFARRMRGQSAPDALMTSTLLRAREVAEVLGHVWKLNPQEVGWAREIHCGELEGVPVRRIQRELPGLWARNEAQIDDAFAWPGGESYADFRTRILRGLELTAVAHPAQRIAIVTHAGVISQVLGVIRGRSAAAWAPDRPRPLSATEIVWRDGKPASILTYDELEWDLGAPRRA